MSPQETSSEELQIDLGTSSQANQAIEYLENGDSKSFKAVKDYFSLLIEKLKIFDISINDEVNYDLILEKTNQMIPVRNEIIGLITTIAKFEENSKFYSEIHSFFEKLLPYFNFRNEGESSRRGAAEHYVLSGSELFLYVIAILLKYRKFEQLNELTHQGYFVPRSSYGSIGKFISFNRFNQNPDSLIGYYKNQDIQGEYSRATYFKDRLLEKEFTYDDLAQADFILYFISLLDKRVTGEYFYDLWSIQLHTDSYPFELFVRSESLWFFEKFAKCLRNISKDEIAKFLEEYKKLAENNMYYSRLDWGRIIALNKLATRP